MKKRFIFSQIVLSLFFFCLAHAQTKTLNIGCTAPVANSFDGRPNGQTHVYVATISNLNTCGVLGATCYYKWEVTEGTIVGAPPSSSNKLEGSGLNTINVKWNNTTNQGKVKVTSGAASCSDCPDLTKEQNINIKYLGTPGDIKVNGISQSGSVAISCPNTNITLSVDAVANATGYQWITPWGNPTGQTVTVTTTNNLSGTIQVLASRSDVPSFNTASESHTVVQQFPHLEYLGSNIGTTPAIYEFCNTSQTVQLYASAWDADSYEWTTTGGVKINGLSGTVITTTNVPYLSATSNGTVSVRSRIAACGLLSPEVKSKTVYFGPPSLSSGWYETNGLTYGLVESEDPPYPNAFCYTGPSSPAISKVNYSGAISNTWTKISSTPSTMPWAQNQYGGVDVTFKAVNQQGLFSVNYANICGNTTKYFGFRSINCAQALTVFPNPAIQDAITIQFDNVENEEAMPQQIALFSEKSTSPVRTISAIDVFKRKSFKDNNKIEIDTRGLEKGIYYLHIVHGKKVNKEKEKIRLLIE